MFLLAIEPPLKITFVRDSPIVSGNNMTAFIQTSKPVSDMKCRMSGTKEVKNCEWSLVRNYNKEENHVIIYWFTLAPFQAQMDMCSLQACQSEAYTHSRLLLKHTRERSGSLNDSLE